MSEWGWILAVILAALFFGVLGFVVGVRLALYGAKLAIEEAERESELERLRMVERRSTGARRAS